MNIFKQLHVDYTKTIITFQLLLKSPPNSMNQEKLVPFNPVSSITGKTNVNTISATRAYLTLFASAGSCWGLHKGRLGN